MPFYDNGPFKIINEIRYKNEIHIAAIDIADKIKRAVILFAELFPIESPTLLIGASQTKYSFRWRGSLDFMNL